MRITDLLNKESILLGAAPKSKSEAVKAPSLAADTSLTESFLRMGIDELSVSPSFVLKVRDAVRCCDLSK